MKMVKRVFAAVVLTLILFVSMGVLPVENKGTSQVAAVEQVQIQNVSVFGYISDPWPGYLIKYAPNYYDYNVYKIQEKLNAYGADGTWCGTPDGFFGTNTLNAVKYFQMNEGLTQDGIVGKITWNTLFYVN